MSTRERILAAARDLFQRRGFHAVGLIEILAAAGAPKGALYHHFPEGKDALGAEAVRGIAADVAGFIDARCAAGESGAGIIGALADMSARRMEKEGFGWSPLIAAVAHQTNDQTPLLRAALAGAHAEWRTGIARAFVAEGHGPVSAEALAATAVALMEGAVVVARIDADAAPLRAVGGQIARLAAAERARSLDVPDGPS
jgi:TetR/AcrR family transcriptional regulator, lmrAB and yxaGH operons repressor